VSHAGGIPAIHGREDVKDQGEDKANSCSASPIEKSRPRTPATHTPKALGDAAARAGM